MLPYDSFSLIPYRSNPYSRFYIHRTGNPDTYSILPHIPLRKIPPTSIIKRLLVKSNFLKSTIVICYNSYKLTTEENKRFKYILKQNTFLKAVSQHIHNRCKDHLVTAFTITCSCKCHGIYLPINLQPYITNVQCLTRNTDKSLNSS